MQIGLSRIKTSVALTVNTFYITKAKHDSNDMTECKTSAKTVL